MRWGTRMCLRGSEGMGDGMGGEAGGDEFELGGEGRVGVVRGCESGGEGRVGVVSGCELGRGEGRIVGATFTSQPARPTHCHPQSQAGMPCCHCLESRSTAGMHAGYHCHPAPSRYCCRRPRCYCQRHCYCHHCRHHLPPPAPPAAAHACPPLRLGRCGSGALRRPPRSFWKHPAPRICGRAPAGPAVQGRGRTMDLSSTPPGECVTHLWTGAWYTSR